MPLKIPPVAFAIIAALLLCAPLLAVHTYADAKPATMPAISIQL